MVAINNVTNKKLKFLHWNANNKSNLNPDIGPLLKDTNSNLIFCLNESFALHNLSVFRLVGVRHQNLLVRGLSLYVSEHLRHYIDYSFSKFTIYGTLHLPPSGKKEALKISFICTYRSPSLTAEQEAEFFDDFNKVSTKLSESSPLVYVLGDFNAYKNRYMKDDTSKIAHRPPCRNSLAYNSLINSIPGPAHFYFKDEITHWPHQRNIESCAKLDYLFVIYSGEKYPAGKTQLWITTSDHRALLLHVNVPFLTNVKIRFKNYDKVLNTDFKFIDILLYRAAKKLIWDAESTWNNFTKLEIYRDHLIEAHSLHIPQRRPKGTKNYESKIQILQNKAQIAQSKNDMVSYRSLCQEIREVITLKAVSALNNCADDEDKKTGLFYKWAGSIMKPEKAETGKFTMINKSVLEMTDPINTNYIDHDPTLPTFRESTPEQKQQLFDACFRFDFERFLMKVKKTPIWFKNCPIWVGYISRHLTSHIIMHEEYPPVLKLCQADILPARSIFQILNPFGKLIENFFTFQLHRLLGNCQNFAYRPNLSTTSLMLKQFDIISRKPVTYGFNGDQMKAFDRLSRRLVYDRIENSSLANIVWSWMDRTDSPYFLWWRGQYHEIDRDKFNRGCPPGSICGPIVYILGQSDHLIFQQGLWKNLFADDSLPLYEVLDKLTEDAEDFADFCIENGMKMHTEGSKAAVYIAFGKEAHKDKNNLIRLATLDGPVEVKRSWKIRQLGLDIIVDSKGRASICLERLINKLKHASVAMRGLSEGTLTGTMIDLLRTYLISLVSYCIPVWYPILAKYDNETIKSVRYWYYSAVCYTCSETKQLLSWANSSHKMRKGNSCELKFKELCGMPTLEELAVASTKAHAPQIRNMMRLGWLDGIIYETFRNKLQYLQVFHIKKKFVSPLRVFIDILNQFGEEKIKFDSKDSILVQVESELKGLTKNEIRLYQRTISLMHFKMEGEYLKRTKKDSKINTFFKAKEKNARKLLKKLKRTTTKKFNLLLDI